MSSRAVALALALALSVAGMGLSGRRGGAVVSKGTARLGILCDTHAGWGFGGTTPYNTYMIRKAVTFFENQGCDAILLAGDWGGGYLDHNHAVQIDSLYASLINWAHIPVIPCMGNWEGWRADTLLHCDPFYSARARFSQYFSGREFFYADVGPFRIISVNDNCNYDVTDPTTDYPYDNPWCGGVVPAFDWSGIHQSGSAQRDMIATALATRGDRRIITLAHRPAFGSDANSGFRLNYNSYGSGRWMRQVLDAMAADEKTISVRGDQHLPEWVTRAIDKDSTVAAASGRGSYEIILASGSGARLGDTTEVFGGAGLRSFLYYNDVAERNYGRTTTGWADTLTKRGDPGLPYQFTAAILQGNSKDAVLNTYRIWTTQSATNQQYTGAGSAKLISSITMRLKN